MTKLKEDSEIDPDEFSAAACYCEEGQTPVIVDNKCQCNSEGEEDYNEWEEYGLK